MSTGKTVSIQKDLPVIGQIYSIPTSEIFPMPDNPYEVRDDSSMQELIESIKRFGIMNPTEVRPREGGGYEMVAGHRRKHASDLAGLDAIPAIILNLDNDDAIIRMVDTNIQRENTLPSEKAKAYKLRMEAMKRKAGRPTKESQENLPKNPANFRSDDAVGEMVGVSGDTIRNYIALTQLVPKLMQMVDNDKIALTPAYQIAALPANEQMLLVETIESEQCTPSVGQVKKMRTLSKLGKLNEDTMLAIMMEQKKPVKSDITLSGEKLRQYFPKSYSPLQMETVIFKLLEAWQKNRQQDRGR